MSWPHMPGFLSEWSLFSGAKNAFFKKLPR